MKINPDNSAIDVMPVPELAQNKVTQLDAAKTRRMQEAMQVAQDFENIFSEMLLKSMRQTIPFAEKQTNATEIYQGMLDSEYSKNMSAGKGLGIQEMVIDWIKNNDALLAGPNEKMLAKAGELQKQTQDFKTAMDAYKAQALSINTTRP